MSGAGPITDNRTRMALPATAWQHILSQVSLCDLPRTELGVSYRCYCYFLSEIDFPKCDQAMGRHH